MFNVSKCYNLLPLYDLPFQGPTLDLNIRFRERSFLSTKVNKSQQVQQTDVFTLHYAICQFYLCAFVTL